MNAGIKQLAPPLPFPFQNIELELAKKAHQLEEGKQFKCVANPPKESANAAKKKGKK